MKYFNLQKLFQNTSKTQKLQILRKKLLNGCECCQWAEQRGQAKNIEGLAPDTLNGVHQHFFAEVDKKGV